MIKNQFYRFIHAIPPRGSNAYVPQYSPQLPFTIVITAYNNGAYARECLTSALEQNYSAYNIVYVDDHSNDNGPNIVHEILSTHHNAAKVTYIRTQTRKKKLANLYEIVHSLTSDMIVIELDGDDALAHTDVLALFNARYQQTNAWLVYANYRNEPEALACQQHIDHFCAPTPWLVKTTNSFRSYPWIYSGLRSYYAGLFKNIKKIDLLCPFEPYKHQLIPFCHDMAYIYPMLEMTNPRIAYLGNKVLIRHIDSPLNDFKTPETQLAQALRTHIRSGQRYTRILHW